MREEEGAWNVDLVRQKGNYLLPSAMMDQYNDLCQYISVTGDGMAWQEERAVFQSLVKKAAGDFWFVQHAVRTSAVMKDGNEDNFTIEKTQAFIRGLVEERYGVSLRIALPSRYDSLYVRKAREVMQKIPGENKDLNIEEYYPEAYGKYFRLLYYRCAAGQYPSSLTWVLRRLLSEQIRFRIRSTLVAINSAYQDTHDVRSAMQNVRNMTKVLNQGHEDFALPFVKAFQQEKSSAET